MQVAVVVLNAHGLGIWRCHVLECRSRGGLGEERLLHRGARCGGSCDKDCGVGSSVVCEEGGSCVGGGRLLCGRRAGVCDPRDPSPTELGESGVRCTHAIPRTPANGIFYKSRGNPTHLVQG